jgi:hypothetical protein
MDELSAAFSMEASMRRFRKLLIASLAVLTALPTSALAQARHVVAPSAIAELVRQHAAQAEADRAAIRQALAQPEVRRLASAAHINVDRLAVAIDGIAGEDLIRAAQAAHQVNNSLVGGATTLVISTTTIIIALLVLLVILVAVD